MSSKKAFNAWIARNFKGLSSATLVQLLRENIGVTFKKFDVKQNRLIEFTANADYIDNMVFVDLYNYFTGDHCDKNAKAFARCEMIVASCDWL